MRKCLRVDTWELFEPEQMKVGISVQRSRPSGRVVGTDPDPSLHWTRRAPLRSDLSKAGLQHLN